MVPFKNFLLTAKNISTHVLYGEGEYKVLDTVSFTSELHNFFPFKN